jgi:hypothetical protein
MKDGKKDGKKEDRKDDKLRAATRKPVLGESFEGSAFPAVALLMGSSLAEAAGIGLVIAWAVAGLDLWALIVGAVVGLGGLGGVIGSLFQQRTRTRLIVALDRLQKVERRGEEESVVLEIPYRNLAEVVYQGGEDERIGIDVIHTGDADTFDASGQMEATKRSRGHHVVLTPPFKQPLRMIYDTLKRRITAARELAPKEG